MASHHRVESGAGLEPGGVLDENLDLPKLLLYGSGIYSALTLALHPLSVLKTRAQASTAPSSLSRGDALRDAAHVGRARACRFGPGPARCRPSGCSGAGRHATSGAAARRRR